VTDFYRLVVCNGFQIFRAAEGATPIFSDLVSEIEALEEVRCDTLKSAILWGLAMIVVRIAAFMMSPSLGSIPWDLLFM